MTPEQSAAYVNAQAAAALATIEAMKVENKVRSINNMGPRYTAGDFMHVIDRYGLHHNAILTTFGDTR